MRDIIMISVDNAVKDGDLEALYSNIENLDFFSEFYPDDVAQQHYEYILEAIKYLETKSLLGSNDPNLDG